MESSKAGEPPEETAKSRRRLLRVGVVGLAVVVGLVAWLATRDDNTAEPAPSGFEAKLVSEAELEEIAAEAGHAVYWAGPLPGTELEASEGGDGSVQVRYLEQGQEVGSDRAGTLTVGSYPLTDAATALEGFAERKGAIVRRARDGTEVVSSAEAPGSVHLASPDGGVQVEVYDPSPAQAMGLALSGEVRPVG
jgi:hypothetical protein